MTAHCLRNLFTKTQHKPPVKQSDVEVTKNDNDKENDENEVPIQPKLHCNKCR